MDAKERNGSEEKSFKAAVITVSDKGARGERVDESGPAAKEMLEEAGYDTQLLEFIDMEHTPKNIMIRQS